MSLFPTYFLCIFIIFKKKKKEMLTRHDAGQPDSHAKAKEILAGFIGAFVDREVETRGLDFVDREKAKRHGRHHAEEQLAYDNQW